MAGGASQGGTQAAGRRRSHAFSLVATSLLLLATGWGCGAGSVGFRAPPAPRIGPAAGVVMAAGGGALGPEIWEEFVALAGGPDARIVVIPTAGTEEAFPSDWSGFAPIRAAGATSVTVLHTRDRNEADTRAFADVLRNATGVWIPGGRQWRLVDSYLNTRTHRELQAVLDRGGVVGGTSAGASILASYLVRGSPETNTIVMAPGYEEGFGLLKSAAVDQHLLARGRELDMLQILAVHPDLLGLGVDEGTAVLIRGDQAKVVGRSRVAVYDPGEAEPFFFVGAGGIIDLVQRSVVEGVRAGGGASGR
jgi:cyanophycinase